MTQEVYSGFKVLRKYGRERISAMIDGKRVYYPFYRWVQPPDYCGPLAVFDDLALACKFMREQAIHPLSVFHCFFTKSSFNFLWRPKETPKQSITRHSLPKGTALADAVYVTEEIK
jgi:hypothetical protein